jgi:hypothetical protein
VRRVLVESSAVAAVGYDAETSILEVEYRSGAVYRYADVPFRVAEDLWAAPSVGRYLNRHVRDRYAFSRA